MRQGCGHAASNWRIIGPTFQWVEPDDAAAAAAEACKSAAHKVRHAMEVFPAVMETRVDLPRLLGAEQLAPRLEALTGRLDKTRGRSAAMLTFLATFMHFNAGKVDQAKVFAEKLKSAAGDDRLLRAYSEFVLSGGKPAKTTKTP